MPDGISNITTDGSRFKIVVYLIFSIVFLGFFIWVTSIVAAAYEVRIPEVIVGILSTAIGGLLAHLGGVLKSFEIGREKSQAADIDAAKVLALDNKECKT